MKKKYFLIGLGIGMVFSSLVLIFAIQNSPKTKKMTDDEIIEKAKQMGMVSREDYDSKTMSDDKIIQKALELGLIKKEDVQAIELTKEEIIAKARELGMIMESDIEEQELTDAEIIEMAKQLGMYTKDEYNKKEPTKNEIITLARAYGMIFKSELDDTTPIEDDDPITIEVVAGMNSIQICKKIEELGAVDDWEKLEEYLERTGLNWKMRTGTFVIPKGLTYEEIGKILTRT